MMKIYTTFQPNNPKTDILRNYSLSMVLSDVLRTNLIFLFV